MGVGTSGVSDFAYTSGTASGVIGQDGVGAAGVEATFGGVNPLAAYVANGFTPQFVVDETTTDAPTYYSASSVATYSDIYTTDTTAGGLCTQNDSSGNLVWGPHNLFINSESPATQNITVVVGAQYTVEMEGTGSIALTGAGTGTASAGSPATITASTTTLTCTVSGSPTRGWAYRSDLGGMADVISDQRTSGAPANYLATGGSAAYALRRRHYRYNGTSYVPTLLHEPVGATNLNTESNDLEGWAFTTGLTSVTNLSSPDGPWGANSLAEVVIDSGNSFHRVTTDAASMSAGNTVVWSVEVSKSTTAAFVSVYQASNSAPRAYSIVRISDGVVTEEGVSSAISGASHIATYVEDNDSTWRIHVVGTLGSSETALLGSVAFSNSATPGTALPVFTGNGTDTIYAGVTQLVQGQSVPSSYIPTTGASVTRSADTCKVKAAALPYDSTAMSFAQLARVTRPSGQQITFSWYQDANNRYILYFVGGTSTSIFVTTAGSGQDARLTGTVPAVGVNSPCRIAGRFTASTSLNCALNGTAGTEDTASVPASPPISDDDAWIFEDGSGTFPVNGELDKLIGWAANIEDAGTEEATA